MATDSKCNTCLDICVSVLLLMCGGAIYLFFRPEVIFLQWLDGSIVDTLHIHVCHENSTLAYILIFCLPDALWYAALLVAQLPFIREDRGNMIVFGVATVLPFALEILQYLQLMPGTFDWLDIASYIIVLITFVLCERRHFFRL